MTDIRKRIIVIGGGHAGTEAAAAAARLAERHGKGKIEVWLITHDLEKIGEMSCNPAIGGLGKGHLVREIDAMGGVMGRAIDKGGIQFRMLNASKGPAVMGPRAQADRKLYKQAVQLLLRHYPNLIIKNGVVKKILFQQGKVQGVELADNETTANRTKLTAAAVVLTTGTFLRGKIYIGKEDIRPAGRWGEMAENELSQSLFELGLANNPVTGQADKDFSLPRLKTGTPARLSKKTIAWETLPKQWGDDSPEPFSFSNQSITQPQIHCALTYTNEKTHEIIRQNLQDSAMYGGVLQSIGPRYCPSIEDKIVRFPDKTSHQIFLEPEGYDDDTVYPNGISTSLPLAIQTEYIRSIKGLEKVEILRPGYTIEYDYIDPRHLTSDLSVRAVTGLYLAGQINGTTGYEEAAGQGLIAGINAARLLLELPPYIPSRKESYLGVMIDDLTRVGVSEPYRMFTARAEHRLFLRADNADVRLTEAAYHMGLVAEKAWREFQTKMALLAKTRQDLQKITKSPNDWQGLGVMVKLDGRKRSLFQLLPQLLAEKTNQEKITSTSLDNDDSAQANHQVINQQLSNNKVEIKLQAIYPQWQDLPNHIKRGLYAESLYMGYEARFLAEQEAYRRDQLLSIPANFDYNQLGGLSNEIKQKLIKWRPNNLAHAAQIEGMTPAGLVALLRALK